MSSDVHAVQLQTWGRGHATYEPPKSWSQPIRSQLRIELDNKTLSRCLIGCTNSSVSCKVRAPGPAPTPLPTDKGARQYDVYLFYFVQTLTIT